MDKRTAISSILCIIFLSATGANAQASVLECSLDGQQSSASFTIDTTKRTMISTERTLPAKFNSHTVSWQEDGALRVIKRDTGEVFRRLPDGSFYRVGKCRPLER